MKIYCMSDIHGCLPEFDEALSLVIDHLEEKGTMLVLLGDYIHGGSDNYGVLDKIMSLQQKYGSEFVHAGIDEEAGDLWQWGTGDEIFVGKYPAETGKIKDLDMKVVAGHIGTAEISGDPGFHDIYYDGESHYYIDGTVLDSGMIPVLLVDTKADKYYRVNETGNWLILPY